MPEGELEQAAVENAVADVARFDVFQLSEAWLSGDAARACRILAALENEGEGVPLLLWQLGEDLHALATVLAATASGTPVANLRMATNSYSGKEEDGTKKEYTEFHSLVAFARMAEVAGELLRKGRLVYVEGRLHSRTWVGRDDQTRYATEVTARRVVGLTPKPSA